MASWQAHLLVPLLKWMIKRPLRAGGGVATVVSLILQGRGHRREPTPAEPFTGAGNALSRIVCEQLVTFPRFVFSGAWRRALRRAPAG